MNSRLQRGFTIIELILFLGVTGALFAGLMVGVNTNINTQRYKESAMSVKVFFEKQFSDTTYPRNARDNNWSCTREAGVVRDAVGGIARGTSGCVVLGRYVTVTNDGATLRAGDVIGIEPSTRTDDAIGDLAALLAYTPRVSPVDNEAEEVAWRSTLRTHEHVPATMSFIVVRSPESGTVRTFIVNESLPEQLNTVLTDDHMKTPTVLCVVPSGFVAVPVHSVRIDPSVGSATGVSLSESDDAC